MKKILFVLIILVFVRTMSAQGKDSTYKYWMTVGFFFNPDITFNLNYSFSLGNNFYKVGYQTKGDGLIWGGFGKNKYLFRSLDFSIGRRLQSKWFQASLFIGPSYVFGKKLLMTNTVEDFSTIGLETDMQVLFRPANEVGIGIGLFGNLNFIKNSAGININLTLGNGK